MKRINVILLLLCFFLTVSAGVLLNGKSSEFLISKTAKYDYCYRIDNVLLDNKRTNPPLAKAREEQPEYKNIIMELMDLTPDKLTEEYRADLTKRLDLYHFDYHWNDDNSLTVISEGEEMTFGRTTGWPTSPEWLKNVPVPEGITVREVEADEDSVRITVSMTQEEAQAYALQLKSAGFTIGAQEITIVGYLFSGTDSEGCTARVTYTSLIQQIEITAPDNGDDPGDDPGENPIIGKELPKTGLIEYLPEFPAGTIESVLEAGDSLTISLSGVSSSAADSFIQKCKVKFNSYVINDTSANGMMMYVGVNDRDVTCNVMFIGEALNVIVSG